MVNKYNGNVVTCGFDQFGFNIVRNYQHKLAVKGALPVFTNLSQLAFLLGESDIRPADLACDS